MAACEVVAMGEDAMLVKVINIQAVGRGYKGAYWLLVKDERFYT